jgi:hypothetical protein
MDPYRHGMPKLQITDGGTASNMEGSCEYVEWIVADSRQDVVLQQRCFGELLTTPYNKNLFFSK